MNTTKKLYRFLEGNDMKVHLYKTASGKDLILEYIESLSPPEIADGYSILQKFKNDELDELKIKHWRGRIWEVYFYKHNRIFYVYIDGENVYFLHACRKQKNKTERSDSDIIVKRAKALGDTLSKKFI